jgi:site-specific recombinase XerC
MPGAERRGDLDMWAQKITVRGKGGRPRVVRIGHETPRSLDRYLRVRSRHGQVWRRELWPLQPMLTAASRPGARQDFRSSPRRRAQVRVLAASPRKSAGYTALNGNLIAVRVRAIG